MDGCCTFILQASTTRTSSCAMSKLERGGNRSVGKRFLDHSKVASSKKSFTMNCRLLFGNAKSRTAEC